MHLNNKKGFTLIELLVVIAIIGILAGVVLSSLNSARSKGRDARRLSDVHQINNALALYYDDHQCYPDCSGSLSPKRSNNTTEWDEFRAWLAPYMGTVPVDPLNTTPYFYTYTPGDVLNSIYSLTYKLENIKAPTYRGGGGANTYNVNPIVVTPSVAAQPGDFIILVASNNSLSNTFTWPSGFTQNAAEIVNTGGQIMRFATKIAGASEPATYSVGRSGGNYSGVAVAIYSGVDTTTPFDVVPSTNFVGTSPLSPWSITALGVAAGSPKRLLVGIAGADNNPGTVITTVPPASPSAWSLRVDTGTTSGAANIAVFDAVDTAGTYTNNVTCIQTSYIGNIGGNQAFLLALRPLP